MKAILTILLISATLFAKAQTIAGRVISVHDGDTFKMVSGDDTVKVRLYGVDCPELKQPYGDSARIFTSARILHKTVTATKRGKPSYKRMVAEVLYDGSKNLNCDLLTNGLAWQSLKYDTSCNYAICQSRAVSAGAGIWRTGPQQPWKYRKSKKR